MKITIPNGKIRKALEKGAQAAFTKEATDDDNLRISPTLNCVKVEPTSEGLSFESHVSQMSIKHEVESAEDITVECPEGICFDASWVLKSCCMTAPDDRNIVLETTSIEVAEGAEEGKVYPNGKLTVSVTDQNGRILSSWNDRTFSTEDFADTSYPAKEEFATIKASIFKQLIEDVIFSANLSDYMEMLDNMAILRRAGRLVLVCTNGKRCAIRTAPEGAATLAEGEGKLMVKADILRRAVAAFSDDDDIVISDCGDGLNALLSADGTTAKIAMPPVHARKKFPDADKVLALEMSFSLDLKKSDLIEGLGYASKINNQRGEYFVTGGEDQITIKSVDEGTTKSNETMIFCGEIPQSLTGNHIFLGNQAFIDFVKRLPGDTVKLSFTEDERRVRVEDPDLPDYVYVMQRMKPPELPSQEG